MDASKHKKEAPKGIIQSKNTTFVHQSTSSLENFEVFYSIILDLSRTVFSTGFVIALFMYFDNKGAYYRQHRSLI